MRPFEIEEFHWPDGIAEKILIKHGLFYEDVEDAFFHREARVRRTRSQRYLLLSRTQAGEYVIVVFAYENRTATVITARLMTSSERKLYKRK